MVQAKIMKSTTGLSREELQHLVNDYNLRQVVSSNLEFTPKHIKRIKI